MRRKTVAIFRSAQRVMKFKQVFRSFWYWLLSWNCKRTSDHVRNAA